MYIKRSGLNIENITYNKNIICVGTILGNTKGILAYLKEFNQEPKGELTIVISEKKEKKKASQELDESDKTNIKSMINKLSIKEITNLPFFNNKVSKKKIYNYCLKLKNEN